MLEILKEAIGPYPLLQIAAVVILGYAGIYQWFRARRDRDRPRPLSMSAASLVDPSSALFFDGPIMQTSRNVADIRETVQHMAQRDEVQLEITKLHRESQASEHRDIFKLLREILDWLPATPHRHDS